MGASSVVQPIDIRVFFNFRSPYCYLVSEALFALFDEFYANLLWRPLGGWDGRSPPERAKKKVPLTRQDVARWAKRLGIPANPPPISTDPTRAGAVSLLAEEHGVLHQFVVRIMTAEWGEGRDIGQAEVLMDIGAQAGLDKIEIAAAMDDPQRIEQLQINWGEADELGVIGVPTFVIGDQVFWGNDRIDFVREYLADLGLSR
jgi:2-hydroxychromene-2-carboxylate isomerase